MAEHNELGAEGETLAACFLMERGYVVLETNWRWGHLEVDLIVLRDGVLHFVEVKTRRVGWGIIDDFSPESAFTEQKRGHLLSAADGYLQSRGGDLEVSIDLVSVDVDSFGDASIRFYEGVHF